MALDGHIEEVHRELVAHYDLVMRTFGERVMRAAVKHNPMHMETKDAAGEFTQRVGKWIEEFAPTKAALIGDTTKTQIMHAMQAGEKLGEGIGEIATRMERSTGGVIGRARAQVIARTETHSASVAAGDEALSAIGLDDIRREWVAVEDGRTRDSHRFADGQKKKQDETFNVGGHQLRYPGDPSGPAAEIINCRCVLIGVIEDEAETLDRSGFDAADEMDALREKVQGRGTHVSNLKAPTFPEDSGPLSIIEKRDVLKHYDNEIIRLQTMGAPDTLPTRISLRLRKDARGRAHVNYRAQKDGVSAMIVKSSEISPDSFKQVLEWQSVNGRLWGVESGLAVTKGESVIAANIRHEIGHILTDAEDIITVMQPYPDPTGTPLGFFRWKVSEYAAVNEREAVAEVFALVTSPSYRKGTLPKPLEDMVKRMLENA